MIFHADRVSTEVGYVPFYDRCVRRLTTLAARQRLAYAGIYYSSEGFPRHARTVCVRTAGPPPTETPRWLTRLCHDETVRETVLRNIEVDPDLRPTQSSS